jgi:ubiquinone/menaquinone biosynthesis C-methylase UbiE
MEALRNADEIRDVNTRYHDVAAESYDSKWGIDFGEVGQTQVLGKLRKILGSALDRGFPRSLEIGAGTGYFTLNLLQAGVVEEATCTDISPGMLGTPSRCRSPMRASTWSSGTRSSITFPICTPLSTSSTGCWRPGA